MLTRYTPCFRYLVLARNLVSMTSQHSGEGNDNDDDHKDYDGTRTGVKTNTGVNNSSGVSVSTGVSVSMGVHARLGVNINSGVNHHTATAASLTATLSRIRVVHSAYLDPLMLDDIHEQRRQARLLLLR